MTWIAERVLVHVEFPGELVTVKVGIPASEDGRYRCAYRITGPGIELLKHTTGYDSVQALQSALQMVAVHLDQLESELGWTLR